MAKESLEQLAIGQIFMFFQILDRGNLSDFDSPSILLSDGGAFANMVDSCGVEEADRLKNIRHKDGS